MQGQKSQLPNLAGGGWFSWELKFLGLFLAFISFSNLIFSKNTFALFVPTLSASVNNSAISVNGNQVINSASQTSELPIRVTVNTNNKTGYTATLNTETDETALVNVGSVSGAKINSIDTNKSLTNFSQNTWGFLSPLNGNYQPIPSLSNSVNLFSTAAKTSGNEGFDFKIGMKLSDNLESGNYTNKLVISIVSNPYERRAVMTTGKDFNRKVDSIVTSLSNDDGWGNKESVDYVYRSTESARFIPTEAINVEDDASSDYPIKIWYDAASKILFYWTEAGRIFLNKDSRYMFRGFTEANYINTSIFDTSEVEDMAYFFYKMNNLQSLDLSKFNTEKVTDMTGMFAYVNSLKKLDLTNFDTSKVTNMSAMFHSMAELNELNIASFNTEKVTNMNGMFYGVNKLATLNLSNFNTSNVENMSFMFHGMGSLENLNLSSFNTRKVNDMSNMFNAVTKLKTLDLTSFNTMNVKTMYGMFYNMYDLETLLIPNFNTENVTNMNRMFYGVMKINSLDLSHFNTRRVTDMDSMFAYMPGLTNINLLSFNTENVEDMSDMFRDSNNLVTIDLSSFNTKKVKDMSYMFSISNSPQRLKTIYVSDNFVTDNVTNWSYAFAGQVTLRGGNGSYLNNPGIADKSWLRIDDPAHGRPGYFTRRP